MSLPFVVSCGIIEELPWPSYNTVFLTYNNPWTNLMLEDRLAFALKFSAPRVE